MRCTGTPCRMNSRFRGSKSQPAARRCSAKIAKGSGTNTSTSDVVRTCPCNVTETPPITAPAILFARSTRLTCRAVYRTTPRSSSMSNASLRSQSDCGAVSALTVIMLPDYTLVSSAASCCWAAGADLRRWYDQIRPLRDTGDCAGDVRKMALQCWPVIGPQLNQRNAIDA